MPQIASPDSFLLKIFWGAIPPDPPLGAHALRALAIHPLPTFKIWLTTSKSVENTALNYLYPKWLNTIIKPVSFFKLLITSVSPGMKILKQIRITLYLNEIYYVTFPFNSTNLVGPCQHHTKSGRKCGSFFLPPVGGPHETFPTGLKKKKR